MNTPDQQSVKFKFAADGVQQTTGAADSVRKAFEKLDGRFSATALSVDNVGAAFGRLSTLAGLAGGLTVAGVAAWATSVAQGVDNLNDLADATGASVENLSALEDVALRSGSSVETAGAAVIKLNKALNDAAQNPKSGAAQVIRDLGLSVDELRKMDPVEALQQIAVAFQGVADDGEKGRALLELTGKSVRELAPLMKDLAESGRLVATVNAEQAASAETLLKRWASLKKDGLDLARSVAIPLVEAMNQVSGAFRDSDQYAGQLSGTAQVLAVPLQTLAVLGVALADTFRGVGTEIGGIAAQAAALARGDLAAVRAIRAEMVADGESARKRYDDLTDRILNLNATANDALRRVEDRGFTPETRRRLPGLRDSGADAAAKKAADERTKLAELTARALVDIEEQAAKDTAEAWGFWEKQQLADQKARVDAEKLQWKQVFDFIDEEQERAIDEGAAMLAALEKDSKGVAEDLALVFSSAAGEAIANFQGLRGVLKGVLADLAQIAIRETVTKPLSAWLTDSLKGFSFASLFAADGRAFAQGGNVLPFADGGVVNSPTLFKFANGTGLMGEAGPEAILPLQRGPGGKLGVAAQGATRLHYAPVINIDSRTDRAQVAALVAQAVQQGQQQMLQYLKAQGAVA